MVSGGRRVVDGRKRVAGNGWWVGVGWWVQIIVQAGKLGVEECLEGPSASQYNAVRGLNNRRVAFKAA